MITVVIKRIKYKQIMQNWEMDDYEKSEE